MTPTQRKAAILVGLGVVLVIAVVWRVVLWTQPREYELKSAVVTRLDVPGRSGEIQFVHPKSGRTMFVAADHIPEDCEILINGERATLADVRVGDTVAVRGLVNPLNQSVQPEWVHVTRAADAPGPTTTPAAAQKAP